MEHPSADTADGISGIVGLPPPTTPTSNPPTSLSLTFHNLVVSTAPISSYLDRWIDRVRTSPIGTRLHLPSTSTPVKPKIILKDVSGYIPPNAITAVMGGSGAGKTTLLNFLAHRLAGGGGAHRTEAEQAASVDESALNGGYHVSGNIRVNGKEVSRKFFAKTCAYVPQQSILLSSLTPKESINFASKLRLAPETTEEEHAKNTDRVLTALSLHSCANTRIGDELTGGGLSGGQKRRVNIGVELVTNPPLLCLDEPTTGLDSLTSLLVMHSLKRLTRPQHSNANKSVPAVAEQEPGATALPASDSSRSVATSSGTTIICSIHQPSASLFALFDHFLLLHLGRVVFCGPTEQAIEYFAAMEHPCPSLENPPEFFLDVVQHASEEEREKMDQIYREYFQRNYFDAHQGKPLVPKHSRKPAGQNWILPNKSSLASHSSRLQLTEEQKQEVQGKVGIEEEKSDPPSVAAPATKPFLTRARHSLKQLMYLTHRAHLSSSRLPLLKGAQILQTIVLGLLIGVAFWNLGRDQLAVQNRLGAVYFVNICVIFANTLSVVLTFSEERQLFLREMGNEMYSVWSYFIARISIEIIPTFLCSLGLSAICFFMMDSSASGPQFGKFMLIVLLLAWCGQGIGLVVSCGIASRMLAMIVTPLAIAPFILFTPYAVNEDIIPYYFLPFQVGSPFWWGFTGLMLNMFDGLQFHCTTDQTISVPLDDGSFYLLCAYESGSGVLDQFNIHRETAAGESTFWVCCGVLAALCICYRVLALIMLYKLSWDVKDATK